jgi:hypothetical protein
MTRMLHTHTHTQTFFPPRSGVIPAKAGTANLKRKAIKGMKSKSIAAVVACSDPRLRGDDTAPREKKGGGGLECGYAGF